MATLNDWDVVDANNNAAPPAGWPESTMQYSEVNDTGRAVQGTLKRYFADLNGSLVAAGVADAYTLNLNESGYTAYFTGMHFACEINAENTGASTINVNSIGVQSIVNRDGTALNAGALQAGGIYEFRYDGTNFQIIGSLAGASVSVDDATFTNSNDPDLVDTDVALNIGASDPTAAQHIEIGPSDMQSKSDATTAAELALNALGGNLRLGPQSGSGNTYLYDAGELKLQTTNIGVSVNGDVASSSPPVEADTPDTVIELYDLNRVTRLGFVGYSNSSSLLIDNEMHGGLLALRGENTAGTLQNCIIADPDGRVELYYQNANKIETSPVSAVFRGNAASSTPPVVGDAVDTYLSLFDTGSNRLSFIGHSGNGVLQITNEMHDGGISLIAEDSGGTPRNLVVGDPGGEVSLYSSGALVATTLAASSGGLQANNTATGGGFERVLTTSDLPAAGFRGAFAYHNTTQVIGATSSAYIALNSEVYDTDTIHDNVTNNTRLTVPSGVTRVRLSGGVYRGVGNPIQGSLQINKNNSLSYIGFSQQQGEVSVAGTGDEGLSVHSGILSVVGGDYFELRFNNRDASSATLSASQTWFSMEILA